jgi:hypothetical protein
MKRHHLIIVAIVLIYVLSTVYVVHTLFFKAKPGKVSEKLIVKTAETGQANNEPEEIKAPEKTFTKNEIEKAKHDYLSGRRSLPPEMNLTEDDVVSEYVYSCSQISEPDQRIRCFDFYFENHDTDYTAGKEGCGSDTACLDEVYYEMAATTQDTYCHAINDEAKREECIRTII